ncbi:hypothetical protein BJI46_07745 [Acinetobacter qingfengensis]|uniref:Excalibur calcium-binding domain-containing protein n=1 Tax=Acinetobacter qingfengensis TaxID=1262585 RepID=A0A1E7RER5_9GAMM|nr:hypothetical protein BJI46_07745 [Acinetobacter qingfengensis]
MQKLLIVLVMFIAVWCAIVHFQSKKDATSDYEVAEISQVDTEPKFHCDGRTHCSQMTSCAEATYFLRNCPGTKMDGNNDGIPCEKQWCK